ncbi:hypothetical protein T4D_3921 [Trichinella pseudospiralis]|uniref:Uncharacterized protein n=1 Tax=Trichinella pseudospiralis TaxID=6337 RepID=A0A0V1G3I8_TRIPS|nr:hypothetical protein T4D_3921 [Trichinella pseudospiralis]
MKLFQHFKQIVQHRCFEMVIHYLVTGVSCFCLTNLNVADENMARLNFRRREDNVKLVLKNPNG